MSSLSVGSLVQIHTAAESMFDGLYGEVRSCAFPVAYAPYRVEVHFADADGQPCTTQACFCAEELQAVDKEAVQAEKKVEDYGPLFSQRWW